MNNNDLCSIGIATAGQLGRSTFGGVSVAADDVLAMFTWGGDANLDGRINIDDYGRIDSNVGQSGLVFGWLNGDFNYDGKINIDDYGIIDGNVSSQDSVLQTSGASASAGPGLDGVATTPEPGGAVAGSAALWLAARHRRRWPDSSCVRPKG